MMVLVARMAPLLLIALAVTLCRPKAPMGPYAVYVLPILPFIAHGAAFSVRMNTESNQNKTWLVPLLLAVRAAMENALGSPNVAWLITDPSVKGPQIVDGVLMRE
jgi:hypothetical protein